MYKLDLKRLGFDIIEPQRRKPIFLAFMYASLAPFEEVYKAFINFKAKVDYETAITAQVHCLEHYLNGLYGLPYNIAIRDSLISNQQIISIEDASYLPYHFVNNGEVSYVDDTDDDVLTTDDDGTGDVYIGSEENFIQHIHYRVKVPSTLLYNSLVLRSQILKYNHLNRQFTIGDYTS